MSVGKRWTEQIEITVDGVPLSLEAMGDLVDVIVDNSLHLPDMFIIRMHDDEFVLADQQTFKLGASVAIKLPLDEETETTHQVIVGEVTAVEMAFLENLTTMLVVRGYDYRHRLMRDPKTRVFIQMTDSDIVQKIGGEAGLSVTAEATDEVYEHVFQINQTDLDFLWERAIRNGYELVLEEKALFFRKPKGERATLDLEWGRNLRSFHPRISLHDQASEVIVKGWDPLGKKVILGRATSSESAPQIGMSQNGVQAISSAFANVKQVTVTHPINSQRDADRLAQALLDTLNADFVTAEGVAVGNPGFVAGAKITLKNVARLFEGTYVVTTTRHQYTPEGYETHFTVEGNRPTHMLDWLHAGDSHKTINGDQAWRGVYLGIVTNNEDPQNMGRVKVKYPWLDDELESFWARTVHVGAGADRGLQWLPEINDEVLIAFEQGDFNRPYILGNVWNGVDAPPTPVSQMVQGGKVQVRTWKTRAGHTLLFVDGESEQYIEIRDATGTNTIKLDAKKRALSLDTQGTMKIEVVSDLEIKSNGNITIEAGANVNIKGGGMINLN